jgi:SNF2 family DNA or RNA helicase
MQAEVIGNLYAVDSGDATRAALHAIFPRVIERKGFTFLPFALESAILLRNAGFDVESPIADQYTWPGIYKPMAHQIATASFLTMNRRAFCLNDMGTGKTLASYWAADYLMRLGAVRRALIVAPLSTLKVVHANTILANFMGPNRRTCVILHGTSAKRRELLKQDYDFYIINFDGISAVKDLLATRDDIDLVVIDELGKCRNATTQRWKFLRAVLRPEQRVWGLTGMPIPNGPTDAWAQVKMIRPESLMPHYPSFRSFKFATLEQVSMYKWIPKPTALDTVARIFQPSIRYSRDECLDLPECTIQTREVEMTPRQKTAYRELTKTLKTTINGGQVNAAMESALRTKLLQVSAGVVYDSRGQHQWIDCEPRLSVTKELIEEQSSKVIIFAPFKGNVAFLLDALKEYGVTSVTGDTSFTTRNAIFEQFQRNGGPKVLVAHPVCMSHGLTLTEASTIIWFAPYDDNEVYEQANARIHRQGQTNLTTVIHLCASAIEREVYKRNQSKQGMQGILLDLLETT